MKKEPKQKSFCVCQTKRSNQTNDNQYGRYGYDRQADNEHDRNGYDHADNQYENGCDHTDYQCSGNERNHRADDQYGGCTSEQADSEGYEVSRRIGSYERHHFYGNDSYIYSKYFWGNHQNNTDT